MNRIRRLRDAGVSIWLDTLSRDLLDTGTFAALVVERDGEEELPCITHPCRLDLEAANAVLSAAGAEGVDLETIASELEHEGVQAFCDSYAELRSCIESTVGGRVTAFHRPAPPLPG
jgi:transaldolase